MNELLNYIDFTSMCEDNDLTSGDITPLQTVELENILQQFINQNTK
tara:strand:+ start:1044 stop:1181 length:138 start_codon:yes stop_codon:yes gene_type:complete